MGDGKPLVYLNGGSKPAVRNSPDLQRILALQRRPPVEPGTVQAEALIEHTMALYSKNVPSGSCNCKKIFEKWGVEPKPCIVRFNYAQAWMLHEIRINSGILAHASTGIGKTTVSVLACLAMPDCKRALLLVPPTLCSQLAREYELIAEHFFVPNISIHYPVTGDGKKKGKGKAEWNRSGDRPVLLDVLPYSQLSNAKSSVYLEEILKPDAILCDELQNLANLHAVRTGRLVRYFENAPCSKCGKKLDNCTCPISAGGGDSIRMGGWSGSITDDSITDYSSLCALCLKIRSPVPLDPEEAKIWGTAIDPDPNGWNADEGALRVLRKGDEDLLDGYNRLLRETPGFVITSGASIDIPLEVRERKAPDMPDVPLKDENAPGMKDICEPGFWPGVLTALTSVRDLWVRPDGEILLDALAVSRCARELACGLFLRWKFYRGETDEMIKPWKATRKDFRSEMREKLKERIPHMDSPMLLANAAMRYWGHKPKNKNGFIDIDDEGKGVSFQDRPDLPVWPSECWPAWYEIKDTVQPVTTSVRLDPFLAEDAALWATENKGIVWYQTVAFGKWVAEISGLPLHEGGPKAGERLSKEDGSRSIIASIKSHGTGRDGLQRLFATQLIAQSPASAVAAEQLFGRLSRIGQEAEKVTAWVYRHTDETKAAFDSAMRKSLYVQKTMGTPQRLTTSWME